MFGSSILDVAIGLIFIYLFLSLVCTAINEWIASKWSKRGRNLFEGISNLLNDPDFTGLAQQVYNHGMVDGISQGAADPNNPTRLPSYMPASNFSLALIDILGARGATVAADDPDVKFIKTKQKAYEDARNEMPLVLADVNKAKAELDNATTALITNKKAKEDAFTVAKQAYDDAKKDADANSGNAVKKQIAADAEATMNKARAVVAAVRMIDAQNAAQASAPSAKAPATEKAKLITSAAMKLEEALAAGRAFAATHPDPLGNIQGAIEHLPPGHTRESLLVLIDKTKREVTAVEGQVDQFQQHLNTWYNDSMDRVGGWYKRWTQKILLGLAVFVVVFANADSVLLVQRLTKDSALRASLVTAAEDAAKLPPPTNSDTPKTTGTPNTAGTPGTSGITGTSGTPKTPGTSVAETGDDPRMRKVLEKAEGLQLPLGWSLDANDPRHVPWRILKESTTKQEDKSKPEADTPKQKPEVLTAWDLMQSGDFWGGLLSKLFGLAVSIFAVSLGAPFWFDTLSKFVNLRGAGTPPGETKKSAPQTKQPK